MGYLTRYELTYKIHVKNPATHRNIKAMLEPVLQDEEQDFLYALTGHRQRMKWYTSEEEMTRLSTLFPDVSFELRGNSEESGDNWVKYFYRGQMAGGQAELVYPPNTLEIDEEEDVVAVKHFCDRCGKECKFGPSGFDFTDGKFEAHITIKTKQGRDSTLVSDICADCLCQIINGVPLVKAVPTEAEETLEKFNAKVLSRFDRDEERKRQGYTRDAGGKLYDP